MSDPVWDGVTRADTLSPEAATVRHRLADAAKAYDWSTVLGLLKQDNQLINVTRLGGQSRYAVLHQAAHGSAPASVIEQLLNLGAWRTLRTAQGERPLDIAVRLGHGHLRDLLTPAIWHNVSLEVLQPIRQHFHAVIRERADQYVLEHARCACLNWSQCLK